MYYVPNTSERDPRVNLAIETYLLRQQKINEPLVFFYINEPSIIIGRNQNTYAEINQDYVNENQIHVVRRLSGGGAVYHDFGNLNFSFISPDTGVNVRDFKTLTQPIVECLHALGVTEAQLAGRNDLVIGDKKFSGNASYATNGRMFSHGTLLFNSEMSEVANALTVRPEKLQSKGIKSVRSRVTNILPHLPSEWQHLSTGDFRDALLLKLFQVNTLAEIPTVHLDENDWQEIATISAEMYRNWHWNYGKTPAFDLTRRQKFPFGEIEACLNVEAGIIQEAKIYGDFFGRGELREFEQQLIQQKYERAHLITVLTPVDFTHYFGPITATEFATFLT
jgi:lipoate-protein ligase A